MQQVAARPKGGAFQRVREQLNNDLCLSRAGRGTTATTTRWAAEWNRVVAVVGETGERGEREGGGNLGYRGRE